MGLGSPVVPDECRIRTFLSLSLTKCSGLDSGLLRNSMPVGISLNGCEMCSLTASGEASSEKAALTSDARRGDAKTEQAPILCNRCATATGLSRAEIRATCNIYTSVTVSLISVSSPSHKSLNFYVPAHPSPIAQTNVPATPHHFP